MMEWLIFTDLDGTLLDHDTYKFDAASKSLKVLSERGVPIVIVTSKTFAEVNELRISLGLNYPFIIENGAAIYFPKEYLMQTSEYPWQDLEEILVIQGDYFVYPFAPTFEFWKNLSIEIVDQFGFACTPFSHMNVDEVSELTGLSLADAMNAKKRGYSDPIHWFGSDELYDSFKIEMARHGLKAVRGGRFVHLLKGTDKGLAVQWLIDFYKLAAKNKPKVMVLGDGDNDVSMLNLADIPVLVRSKSHRFPTLNSSNSYQTKHYGPEGWSEAIQKFIA